MQSGLNFFQMTVRILRTKIYIVAILCESVADVTDY